MPSLQQLISTGILVLAFLLICNAINTSYKKLLAKHCSLQVKFLYNLARTVVVVVFVYSILSQFSLTREISATLLQSGSLIIAVATFAAQQALGNIISGISISAAKPLDVGQKVKLVSGSTTLAEGIVTNMTLRHVVIDQFDGQSCIIPNSVVDSCVIVNTNYVEHVGNFLEFEISYDADIEKAKQLIREALEAEPLVIRKDVSVLTSQVSQNGMVLKFTVWTKDLNDSFTACSNLREQVVKRFMEEGIDIPYNTVDVHLSNGLSES